MDYPNSPALRLFNGKFTDGNTSAGIAASIDSAVWANSVTDEILNVIAEAGIAPNVNIVSQLRDAITSLISNSVLAVVDGAPTPLNTLNKIAESLVRRLSDANNLSDVQNIAAARNNLDVYSRAQADTAITTAITAIIDNAPDDINTIREAAEEIRQNESAILALIDSIAVKIDESIADQRYMFDSDLVGFIFPFGGTTATIHPKTLPCAGAAVSRTTYARLLSVIGTAWGAGNGSTTYNLPDLRAEVLRGYDDGRGVDPGRILHSLQLDQVGSHFHGMGEFFPSNNDDAFLIRGQYTDTQSRIGRWTAGEGGRLNTRTVSGSTSDSIRTGNVSTNPLEQYIENRMRNRAVIYVIKY